MKNLIDILDLKEEPNIIEEIMKMIDRGHWKYKEFDIYLLEHPKLYVKYEIYKEDKFVKGCINLPEAKNIINNRIEQL